MAGNFRKVLSAFRIVASMPAAESIQPLSQGQRNGDLSCDEDGALWVRPTNGSGGGSGSLTFSASFTSYLLGGGFAASYTVRSESLVGTLAALQSIHAHAAEFCYLQLFNVDAPMDGNAPMYEWACPYPGGIQESFGYPWGLRILQGLAGITFAFSSTPGFLTAGPLGYVHGIYSTDTVP